MLPHRQLARDRDLEGGASGAFMLQHVLPHLGSRLRDELRVLDQVAVEEHKGLDEVRGAYVHYHIGGDPRLGADRSSPGRNTSV
jgi:hypothetical protein